MARRGGALREQVDRFSFQQGRQLDDILARHAQRLAAGGQREQLRCEREQARKQVGTLLNEVLAVVDHEERSAVPRKRAEGLDRGKTALAPATQRGGQRLLDRAGHTQSRQVDESHGRVGGRSCSISSLATASASLVLPTPPGPVSVSNRALAKRCLTSAISLDLPMKLVSAVGRL
jgi:hypothetical protein